MAISFETTLRIFSESMHPDEISAVLGIPPTRVIAKGPHTGRVSGLTHVTRIHAWLLTVSGGEDDIEAQLTRTLDLIESRHQEIQQLQQCCRLDVFIGSFLDESGQGSIGLSSAVMGRFSRAGVDVVFDVYGGGE